MSPTLLVINPQTGRVRRYTGRIALQTAQLDMQGDLTYLKSDLEMFRRTGNIPESVEYYPGAG